MKLFVSVIIVNMVLSMWIMCKLLMEVNPTKALFGFIFGNDNDLEKRTKFGMMLREMRCIILSTIFAPLIILHGICYAVYFIWKFIHRKMYKPECAESDGDKQ